MYDILYKYRYICICYSDNKFIHPHKVVVEKGDTVQFSCSSFTKVAWSLSSTKVIYFPVNVKQLVNNTIVVENVQKINEGDYYCVGRTPYGVQTGMKKELKRKKELTNFVAKASLWIRGNNNSNNEMMIAYILLL